MTLLGGSGDHDAEAFARNRLGEVLRRRGQLDEAFDQHQQAMRLARDISARFHEIDALIGLADTARDRGEPATAADHAGQAITLAGRIGYRILEGRARRSLETFDGRTTG